MELGRRLLRDSNDKTECEMRTHSVGYQWISILHFVPEPEHFCYRSRSKGECIGNYIMNFESLEKTVTHSIGTANT